ncbi:F-box only protein 6 [Octodon degus]|uniref:F-box only protein 6 n=1 Tax=Octodon degus TaxID=10160 RepID=A0A6P3FL36_OCTDE|nr:F-box only protein 6 [Octodon degus]
MRKDRVGGTGRDWAGREGTPPPPPPPRPGSRPLKLSLGRSPGPSAPVSAQREPARQGTQRAADTFRGRVPRWSRGSQGLVARYRNQGRGVRPAAPDRQRTSDPIVTAPARAVSPGQLQTTPTYQKALQRHPSIASTSQQGHRSRGVISWGPAKPPSRPRLAITVPTQACALHPTMALVSINELPENILLELFTLLPACHLLRRCRPVCSLWRDLIDLMTLWKRKCLREGFITEHWDQPVANWKVFYFLCSLRRNLLQNPCAEEGMKSWKLDANEGDQWKVESVPGAHGTNFPDPKVKKYFVTSHSLCLKSQLVNLKAKGYWDELLDTYRPDIEVKDWFAARRDCGCTYQIRVHLVSADYITLASFEPQPVTIEQWNDASWTEVSHTFSDYPPGVRHIFFQHGGQDTQFWAGWYGPRVTNSSIIISNKMTRKLAPSTALSDSVGAEEAAQPSTHLSSPTR